MLRSQPVNPKASFRSAAPSHHRTHNRADLQVTPLDCPSRLKFLSDIGTWSYTFHTLKSRLVTDPTLLVSVSHVEHGQDWHMHCTFRVQCLGHIHCHGHTHNLINSGHLEVETPAYLILPPFPAHSRCHTHSLTPSYNTKSLSPIPKIP